MGKTRSLYARARLFLIPHFTCEGWEWFPLLFGFPEICRRFSCADHFWRVPELREELCGVGRPSGGDLDACLFSAACASSPESGSESSPARSSSRLGSSSDKEKAPSITCIDGFQRKTLASCIRAGKPDWKGWIPGLQRRRMQLVLAPARMAFKENHMRLVFKFKKSRDSEPGWVPGL